MLDSIDFSWLEFFNITLLRGWADNIISSVIILTVGFFASRYAATLIRRSLGNIKVFDKTLIPLIASLSQYAILIITIIGALNNLGVQTTSIIAVIGAAGLAIALALQGTLSNVAAGFMLIFLRPFKLGDWVEAGGTSGAITEIGLFTTIITTFDNVFISVPNSAIWNSTIINHARNKTRRLDLDIGIAYATDLDFAEETLLALAKDPRVMESPVPEFLIVNYGDNAITVRLRLYAKYDDYFELHWDLMRKLKPVLDKAGIEIPFPQRDYRLIDADKT